MQDKPTLCWKCEKACGGCSWSADFKPVDGWKAKKTIISANHGNGSALEIESYLVRSCPKFSDDTARYKRVKTHMIFNPVMIKRPNRQRCNRNSLRYRIWQMADREERIDRLNGDGRTVAELVFRFNNTIDDVCAAMNVCDKTAKRILHTAMEQMEAMT